MFEYSIKSDCLIFGINFVAWDFSFVSDSVSKPRMHPSSYSLSHLNNTVKAQRALIVNPVNIEKAQTSSTVFTKPELISKITFFYKLKFLNGHSNKTKNNWKTNIFIFKILLTATLKMFTNNKMYDKAQLFFHIAKIFLKWYFFAIRFKNSIVYSLLE